MKLCLFSVYECSCYVGMGMEYLDDSNKAPQTTDKLVFSEA